MPRRFPPAEPEALPKNPTDAQIRRHQALSEAWLVGEALRELAATMTAKPSRDLPDEISYLGSPTISGMPSSHRLADNGTPDSMNVICNWIDRQARTVIPVKRAYEALRQDLPLHAQIAWMRHVQLLTVQEIAVALHISERTIVRHLGIAHMRLIAGLRIAAGTKTGRRDAGKKLREADYLEAQWRRNQEQYPPRALTGDELARGGVETRK